MDQSADIVKKTAERCIVKTKT